MNRLIGLAPRRCYVPANREMRQFLVYRPPANRVEAWRATRWPKWLLRIWPVRYGPAQTVHYDAACGANVVYYITPSSRRPDAR